jgi:hypothetical protein
MQQRVFGSGGTLGGLVPFVGKPLRMVCHHETKRSPQILGQPEAEPIALKITVVHFGKLTTRIS